jgi:hypothetical protein
MKTKIPQIILAGLLGTAMASQGAVVVYQSDFTGTTLASAGLATSTGTNGTWTLDTVNDRATGVSTGANPRANLFTTGSGWQSTGGFTLNVTFNQQTAGARYSFGIVDADYTISTSTDYLNGSVTGAYGIGYSALGERGDSLVFNQGTGATTGALSNAQGGNTPGNNETMTITVTPTTWSYSLNGQTATTGTFATAFDTSRSYRFAAHAQNVNQQYISNITLTAIPEPNVAALLGGLGTILLLRRRRR